MVKRYDFLVIGGGIAGLTYALKVAEHGSCAILFKKDPSSSSTLWAQGGIAAVHQPDDSFELHVQDTLDCGAGLCKPEVVELVVREGPERVRELIELGAIFDKQSGGEFHLNREGGHSIRRIFHAGVEHIAAAKLHKRRAQQVSTSDRGCNFSQRRK